MEQLRNIEQCLVSTVQTQLGDLKHVNAKEMGEVIDMIKDLEEAMYYCSIMERGPIVIVIAKMEETVIVIMSLIWNMLLI